MVLDVRQPLLLLDELQLLLHLDKQQLHPLPAVRPLLPRQVALPPLLDDLPPLPRLVGHRSLPLLDLQPLQPRPLGPPSSLTAAASAAARPSPLPRWTFRPL